MVPGVLVHIPEAGGGAGILVVDLHEGGLNGHLGPGHLEGILAIALVGQLDLVPILVGDGQLVQLIALVGLDGDGHRPAAGGALGGHGHTAVVNVLVHADGVAAGAAATATGGGDISVQIFRAHSRRGVVRT